MSGPANSVKPAGAIHLPAVHLILSDAGCEALIAEYGDWYPWVMPMDNQQPSSDAGQQVRFFLRGDSDREIVFRLDAAEPPAWEADPAIEPGRRFLSPPVTVPMPLP